MPWQDATDAEQPVQLAVFASACIISCGDDVLLHNRNRSMRLPGGARLATELLRAIDGTRTRIGVITRCSDQVAAAALLDLLIRLDLAGIEAREPIGESRRVLVLGSSRWSVAIGLALTHAFGDITVESEKSPDPGSLASSPTDIIPVPHPSLLIDATPFPAPTRADRLGSAAAHGIPVVSAMMRGETLILGPLTTGRGGPCRTCLLNRMLAAEDPFAPHAPQWPDLDETAAFAFSHAGSAPALLEAAAAQVALTFGHLGAEKALSWRGRIETMDMRNGVRTVDDLAAMPWCIDCGGAAEQSNPLKPVAVGGLADLIDRSPGWLGPRVGMVTAIHPAELPVTLPLHACHARLAHPHDGQRFLGYSEWCTGKGASAAEARGAAFAEATERYAGAVLDRSRMIRANLANLPGEHVDPRRLCLYGESQYVRPGFPFVRFDPTTVADWIGGIRLDDGAPVLLPSLAVHIAGADPGMASYMQTSSNGLAAGETIKDATIRALCEVIERDALYSAWMMRAPVLTIRHSAAIGAENLAIIAALEAEGARITLHALATEEPIATVLAVGRGNGEGWPGLSVGAGADPNPAIALRKALSELALSGGTRAVLMRRGELRVPEKTEVVTYSDHAAFYAQGANRGAADFLDGPADIDLSALPIHAHDLEPLVADLSRRGMRAAMTELTTPDLALTPIRVVRVIVPDLQPPWCGYGRQRVPGARLQARLGSAAPNPDLPPFS